MKIGEQAREVLVLLWLGLVAVGFWGPYLAVLIPTNAAHALYAIFLIVAFVTLILKLYLITT